MPWDANHKAASRERIIESASRLFTHLGFDMVSIDDVMNDAGLTRGAFYAHFKSKSDLYDQAIQTGPILMRHFLNQHPGAGILDFAQHYLRIGDEESKGRYCPLAFLVTDISHRDKNLRTTYTRVLKGYQDVLVSFGLTEDNAIKASVILIGGLALSRAVTDRTMKEGIIRSCLTGIEQMVRE